MGSDGNAYLVRRTSPALVYVISAHGVVLRKLRVGSEDPLMLPQEVHAFPQGLVFVFGRNSGGMRMLKAVGFHGNAIAAYPIDLTSLGPLACYAPPTFTFLGTMNDEAHGFRYLSNVEPN